MRTATMAEPTTRLRGLRRGALVLLGAVLLVAGGLLGAGRAMAWVGVPESGLSGMLSLRTLPGTPQWAAVVPGQVVHWRIAAEQPVETWDLAPLAVGASRYLHVMLVIPEDAQAAGRSARVGIGVTAQGDDPVPGGGPAPRAGPAVPALAATGLDWLMIGLLGAGVLLLGVGLRTGARTRSVP